MVPFPGRAHASNPPKDGRQAKLTRARRLATIALRPRALVIFCVVLTMPHVLMDYMVFPSPTAGFLTLIRFLMAVALLWTAFSFRCSTSRDDSNWALICLYSLPVSYSVISCLALRAHEMEAMVNVLLQLYWMLPAAAMAMLVLLRSSAHDAAPFASTSTGTVAQQIQVAAIVLATSPLPHPQSP